MCLVKGVSEYLRPKQDVKLLGGIHMKKYYDLHAVINGESHQFSKRFSTRDAAMDYVFKFFKNIYYRDLQIEDEYQVENNKHDIEYVFDHYNRFAKTGDHQIQGIIGDAII